MFLDLRLGALHEPRSGRTWSPAAIRARIAARIAHYGRLGIGTGDRVFCFHGNTLEFFADLLAVWSLGASAVPVDSRLAWFEIETLVRCARPRFALWRDATDLADASRLAEMGVRALASTEVDSGSPNAGLAARGEGPAAESARGRVPFALDGEALILFTSGTTGQPKGVVHTHRSLLSRWMSLRDHLGTANFRRTLCLLPTHFGHGLICNCLFPWLSGQELFIVPPFQSDLLLELGGIIDEHRITFLSSVPSVWNVTLKMGAPPRAHSLERVFCGSAPLSAHTWVRIQEWAGIRDVYNAYGITETGSWVAGTTVRGFTPEDGLVGEPWGAVVKILQSGTTDCPPDEADECAPGEAGHVWLKTPALMQGYLGRDDLTDRVLTRGWFLTGDIGTIDERGWLYLRGRERDEINKGGMKIFPADIDAVIDRFEHTADVCAFGYSDPLYGEEVGVAIVLRRSDAAALRALYEFTALHLAKHKLPRRWYLLDTIPRTSRGKVNRGTVAETCAGLESVNPAPPGPGPA